jgi:uncharacterized protein (DUF488 family)
MNTNNKIYTIGHSMVSNAFFLSLLRKYEISCVVDVRSVPFSRHAPHYNKEELSLFLARNSVRYVFMGDEFGARRNDPYLYPDGYLNFEYTRKSALFLQGVERIKKGLHSGFTIALMCTEKQAIDCHRSILVAKGLSDAGFEVTHIGHDNKAMSQRDLEKELLKVYFPETNMFAEQMGEPMSEIEMIEETYRRKNLEIGFRGLEEKEAAHI